MTVDYSEFDTPDLFNKYLGGQNAAFDEVLRRHNGQMLRSASRLLRCIQMYDAAYEPEDAVASTLMMLHRCVASGKLETIQASFEFWKLFYTFLRREIRAEYGRYNAAKRTRPSRAWDAWEMERRYAAAGNDVPSGRGYQCRKDGLDWIFASLPPPEDLVLASLEIEEVLRSLDDPALRTITELRLEDWTVAEIAQLLEVSTRTVERGLSTIREAFSRARSRE
jgi:RNA polymerase sigma factor (sigma-70 family)